MFQGAAALYGIHSLFGPNWNHQVELLCETLGQETADCQLLKEIKVGPIAGGEIMTGNEETSIKLLKHLAQLNLEDRF